MITDHITLHAPKSGNHRVDLVCDLDTVAASLLTEVVGQDGLSLL